MRWLDKKLYLGVSLNPILLYELSISLLVTLMFASPMISRLFVGVGEFNSEMGAHFSPCGRFLAACVACVLPPPESEMQGQGQRNMNGSPGGGNTVHSPTQHPISSQQVIYELRVYSLEEAT